MKVNMGMADRIIRIIVAALLLLAVTMHWVSGILAIIAVVLAVVFLGTSVIRFCPLYLPFGINTHKKG
jgi:hypothetical protein